MASQFPENLYVQKGFARSSRVEELFTNSTPEKAASRDLGTGQPAGQSVAVYKLERVVQLKIGITEVAATEVAAEVPTQAAGSARRATDNRSNQQHISVRSFQLNQENPMSVTAEQLLEQAQKVLEARGFRVTQVSEAEAAEAAAAKERTEATDANSSEDSAIEAFKSLASEYTKE